MDDLQSKQVLALLSDIRKYQKSVATNTTILAAIAVFAVLLALFK